MSNFGKLEISSFKILDSSNKEVETNLDFTRSQNYSSSNSIEGTFSNSCKKTFFI